MTQYVLLKRDLYECPGHMGYTGIRDKAGTWPAEDFAHHGIPIKEKYTPKERDSYAIPFDAAPEFTNECFHDLSLAHLKSKVDELSADNRRLRQLVSDCASALATGAFISPQASIEFMENLPREIRLTVARKEAA
ncbi:hypothetical protein [Rhizobium binae]|uniref:hypothetical protein n=1 Tax=Rhizobium binae TaxID=1138190 RepID=UPI001C833835|nr:hypothetical protein [Rhizobium binae]MBX4941201.1 hypothetical protein [Rhizobium binae]